ncbi:ABC transporter ATP-binding protein [Microbacterium sp.]|jgi:putative ABC transport system ATP-binding protein|uniref:ABC transporter ATP-binding protein n=1 Tax=Microbacterium sp. TaxID=51671 RepID=UPI0037C66533
MSTSTPPVLSASGLIKQYGELRALDEVSLTIRAGESVAVMGASGSGKTTLLHCLAAILPPDGGSIVLRAPDAEPRELAGLDEGERARIRRTVLGFVFQEHLLLPELTAVENAALPLLLQGQRRQDAERHAAAWLAALGLAGLEQRRIGQLSGGQAQRVAIARAQVTGAPIVFADEPTGALDSATSSEVLSALLNATTGQRRTLVMVTHDPDVARRCSRIVRLRDGRIVDDAVVPSSAAANGEAAR